MLKLTFNAPAQAVEHFTDWNIVAAEQAVKKDGDYGLAVIAAFNPVLFEALRDGTLDSETRRSLQRKFVELALTLVQEIAGEPENLE